jgi:hypothetical protein
MHPHEHRQLLRRRERNLGRVQDLKPVLAKPVRHQGEERFAMRLLVK